MAVFGLLLGAGLVAAGPAVFAKGIDFDHGLYRVAIDSSSPLEAAIASAPQFERRIVMDPRGALSRGEIDIWVSGERLTAWDTDKGNAALAALEKAVASYTHARLLLEKDKAAAFPVEIELEYVARTTTTTGGTQGPGPGDAGALGPAERSGEEASGTATGGSETTASGATDDDQLSRYFSFAAQETTTQTPSTLSPPFPFKPLVLAYLFLVPMNFVVLVYGGSMMNERLASRGEALLATPSTRLEIIAGKTLPYLLLIIILGMFTGLFIGAGFVSLLAVLALGLAFLGLVFVAAMLSRSFRELTFLTVMGGVLLTAYAFVPAIFSEVHPIALISPITLVVFELRSRPVELAQVLYAVAPLTLVAGALFHLGSGLYTEEDLFHQKSVGAKLLDALARPVRGIRSGFALSLLLLPFVLVAELLLVALLFTSPISFGLAGALLGTAALEEVFKALPSYAAVTRGAIEARKAPLFGALTGAGFFVAEKSFLLVSLIGLYNVPIGAAVLGEGLAGATGGVLALLLLAPLVLHTVTASISAKGATMGRRGFLSAVALAILIHLGYNLLVLQLAGGGLD